MKPCPDRYPAVPDNFEGPVLIETDYEQGFGRWYANIVDTTNHLTDAKVFYRPVLGIDYEHGERPVCAMTALADERARLDAFEARIEAVNMELLGAEIAPTGPIPMALQGVLDVNTVLEPDEMKP